MMNNSEIIKLNEIYTKEKSAAVNSYDEISAGLMEDVDLTTLLVGMETLKTELRKETLAVRNQREEIAGYFDQIFKLPAFSGRAGDYEHMIKTKEKEKIDLLIDMADRLDRSIHEAEKLTTSFSLLFWMKKKREQALLQGLQITKRWLNDILTRSNIKKITTLNCQFDPEYMEAIEVKKKYDCLSGTVLEEVTAGYLIDSKLYRYAKVVVCENKGDKNEK